jgi:hypothetical protein
MARNLAHKKSTSEEAALVKAVLCTVNPYCILPAEYFEQIESSDGQLHYKKMLSISSSDGREIFTLERINSSQS